MIQFATRKILVVGAGFSGAVHARELAEAGYWVEVIDRRPHIAGNAHDEVLACGTRIHQYGPHLFHTNNAKVVDWLRRFSDFVSYDHRVQSLLPSGKCVPLPINRRTVNEVFGKTFRSEKDIQDFLAAQAEPIPAPANAAEHLASRIGRVLTDLFFRPYTRKMWALDLEELHPSVVQRIPIRFDDEDRYFPGDIFQLLPTHGYTNLFHAILDHPRIRLTLNQPFEYNMLSDFDHCFASMAIDEYFHYSLGALPYRSIRFEHRQVDAHYQIGTAATINYTDDRPFTRETDWSRLPGHHTGHGNLRTLTLEQPCADYENNMERYYPVRTSDGRFQDLYGRYAELACAERKMTFIGRCGTYQYLDMHQVINQSLQGVGRWLKQNPL
jgi:UDP-galactopyranose mutase